MPLPLLKPDLYRLEGTTAHPLAPALLGGRCTECGYTFFPLQRYGCERCGATAGSLQPHALSGRGTLDAQATVHLHHLPARQAPFEVVAVHLEDGPRVRTLWSSPQRGGAAAGAKVVAVLEEVDVPGSDPPARALDLRFAAA